MMKLDVDVTVVGINYDDTNSSVLRLDVTPSASEPSGFGISTFGFAMVAACRHMRRRRPSSNPLRPTHTPIGPKPCFSPIPSRATAAMHDAFDFAAVALRACTVGDWKPSGSYGLDDVLAGA